MKKTEEARTKLALQTDFNLEAAQRLFSAKQQSFELINLLPFTEEYASLVVDRSKQELTYDTLSLVREVCELNAQCEGLLGWARL